MKNYKAKDFYDYSACATREARPHLEELRKIIKSTIPKAEEGISWGVPFYKYHGLLSGFAAHKNHVGIWFPTVRLQGKDRKNLESNGYKVGEKTIQIKFDQKIPVTAIKQMLKKVAKMNEVKKVI